MTDADHEDLEALVGSKGWGLLVDIAKRECQTQKDDLMAAAARDLDDVRAIQKLRIVMAFTQGVEFVLKLPIEQIAKSDRAEKAHLVSPGRRGPL